MFHLNRAQKIIHSNKAITLPCYATSTDATACNLRSEIYHHKHFSNEIDLHIVDLIGCMIEINSFGGVPSVALFKISNKHNKKTLPHSSATNDRDDIYTHTKAGK